MTHDSRPGSTRESPFWLSHHHPAEYNRTFEVAGIRLCARCAATYPVAALVIALQFAKKAPLAWAHDLVFGVVLLLPALIDWAVGRFRPNAGSNPLRFATGALLGIALGRSLYIHLQKPLPKVLVAQLLVSLAVAIPVLLWTYRRKNVDIDRR